MTLPRSQPSIEYKKLRRSRPAGWFAMALAAVRDESTYGVSGWQALGTIAVLCCLGSFVCAFVYIAVMHAHLPANDSAANESLLAVITDPFVVVAGGVWSLVSAAFVFPFAAVLLRGRKIAPTFLVVLAATLEGIALITPHFASAGWFTSYVVVAGLILCRLLPAFARASDARRARA